MELLESAWFFRMVEQQGKTPAQRLLAIFSVLETWLAAPGMRERLVTPPHEQVFLYHNPTFKDFLTRMAVSARARQPASLVNQLIILLQGALAEDLRNPNAGALAEAGNAAVALINEACPSRQSPWHWAAGGMAAAVAALALVYPAQPLSWVPSSQVAAVPLRASAPPPAFNPDSMDAVLALQELIVKGVCPPPQLLAMPPGQVTAYMNAIHFRTPDDPAADRKNLRAFLNWFEKTRLGECYMPPANGHTKVAWVQG